MMLVYVNHPKSNKGKSEISESYHNGGLDQSQGGFSCHVRCHDDVGLASCYFVVLATE